MSTTTEPILPALGHLVVYRKSLAVAQAVLGLQVQGSLRDQLHRAVESTTLNIAEGAGERSMAAKNRYYAIARASLWEVAAALDLLAVRRGRPSAVETIATELRQVDAILAALLRRS